MAAGTTPMTAEEFFALPDDGVERWLLQGELREKPMTKRNRFHSHTMANLSFFLTAWNRTQPQPRGRVYAGDVGCTLGSDPLSVFGIDVAYLTAEQVAKQPTDGSMLEGPPTLAIEILSPSNTIEDVEEKTRVYRSTGVQLVWIVNPYSKFVIAYRPEGMPELYHLENDLLGNGVLPGFRTPVADLFA